MKSYFYIDNSGKQNGPIPASLLKQHGCCLTYVWAEGMSSWTEASKVPELRTIFPVMSPPPAPPLYQAVPTDTNSVQCSYCKSYLTYKQTGKIAFRYILIIGAGLVGLLLTPIVAFLASRAVYQATEYWENWECISCKKSFWKA